MSEQAPRSNPRLDNFESNKAAHEQAQYEDALYGEAGKTDFSDAARSRIEEADAYERHLESIADRDESYDEVAANTENDDYKDGIDRAIEASAELRRMDMIARSIAEAYATEVTPENADRLPQLIKDKEDKLEELLVAFSENSDLPDAQKDAIIERIINATEHAEEVAAAMPERVSSESDESQEATDQDQVQESEAEEADEDDIAAREGEDIREYEARHGVNPDLAIDPNELPIAVPEMPDDNPEQEQQITFEVGDVVRVQRTSGDVEDNWQVLGVSSNGPNGLVLVSKEGVGTKRIPWQELAEMQSLEVSHGEEDDESSHEDREEANGTPESLLPDSDELLDEDTESGPDSRARNWFKRAKDAINGGLTKLYFSLGSAMNKLVSNERKEGETDEEYNERMKRNGRRAAIGITAVAAAYGAYRLYHGIDSGSGGAGGSHVEHAAVLNPTDPLDGQGGGTGAHSETLNSGAWNIPKGSGGEALMDRLGSDKSVWYQHQNEFLQQFPDEAYRMGDGNVGLNDEGRLSQGAIDFWSQYISR